MTTLNPSGWCYCGCGSEIAPGAFFRQGHDKKADADLNAIHHGDTVAQRIVDRGYGPGGVNLHERAIELGVRERCGIDDCNVSGVPGSYGMRRHRASHQHGSASSGRASD
ncbi:hypothetical protein [Amycolatopsis sp. 195334CR]|uniref:hypothetical protein n=1 Tax=Amycolatopsis sp. 195334CR TaxID=2814588 RepID=UPI001A8EF0D7|nr:hypothetical protein [Amycolatopsis sp. 195334CR]MBN6034068.1 hypothetical protein [Amycolatopsis sp. 195334CR]